VNFTVILPQCYFKHVSNTLCRFYSWFQFIWRLTTEFIYFLTHMSNLMPYRLLYHIHYVTRNFYLPLFPLSHYGIVISFTFTTLHQLPRSFKTSSAIFRQCVWSAKKTCWSFGYKVTYHTSHWMFGFSCSVHVALLI